MAEVDALLKEGQIEDNIITKPMLETAKKNFIPLPFCQSLNDKPTNIKREELTNIPNSHCFILNNLLTPEECAFYIKECEKVGFSCLADEFPSHYRINDRVLTLSQEMADALFARMEPLLTRSDVIRIRPIGFGNEGTWRPIRLNECIKIMKYTSGGHFTPHFDGPWVPREDESSVYTVLIYLNTEYTGGETKFIDEDNPRHVYHQVTPCVGMGLVFNHDSFHEGTPVLSGVKYLLRTEVMFRRVDTQMIPNPGRYEESESYNTALTLYRKSWQLEQNGDATGFTDTYLQAIRLQMQAQRTVSADYRGELFKLAIPYELYIRIFSYLSANDVIRCMQVCKLWYDLAMDGELWFELYKGKWPYGYTADLCLKESMSNPLIIDWYGNFRAKQAIVEGWNYLLVIDLGGYEIRCARMQSSKSKIHKSEIRSVVARVPGIYDFHMRKHNSSRFFCGNIALSKYPGNCTQVVERGRISDVGLLPEILFGMYYDCMVFPKQTSVLCLVSPLYCSEADVAPIVATLREVYRHYRVRYIPQSVAVCVGNGEMNAIVVNLGYESGWVSLVINGNSVVSEAFELSMKSDVIISKIEQIILKSDTDRVSKALFFVGGNLNDGLINQLKHCYYQRKGAMEYISKVIYCSKLDGTLMAGVEYANSLSCCTDPDSPKLSFEQNSSVLSFYRDLYDETILY